MRNNKKLFIGLVVLVLIIVAACVVLELKDRKSNADGSDASSQTTIETTTIQETTTEGLNIQEDNADDGFSELIPLN
jgi:uncharacterized protein YpmS